MSKLSLRIHSGMGVTRVDLAPDATIGELKFEIKKRLDIEPSRLGLFADRACTKRINGPDM